MQNNLMKKISLLLSLTLLALLSVAQTTPVSLVKKANHFLYMTKSYGQQVDTAFTHTAIRQIGRAHV